MENLREWLAAQVWRIRGTGEKECLWGVALSGADPPSPLQVVRPLVHLVDLAHEEVNQVGRKERSDNGRVIESNQITVSTGGVGSPGGSAPSIRGKDAALYLPAPSCHSLQSSCSSIWASAVLDPDLPRFLPLSPAIRSCCSTISRCGCRPWPWSLGATGLTDPEQCRGATWRRPCSTCATCVRPWGSSRGMWTTHGHWPR